MREEHEARETAYSLLDYVGLSRQSQTTSKNLSYGDQRRLEVARALASGPSLLLLDEPTAGMNPRETAAMTTFIDRMRRELNLTILLIEHDMKVVMGISDEVAVLDHGIKIADGTGRRGAKRSPGYRGVSRQGRGGTIQAVRCEARCAGRVGSRPRFRSISLGQERIREFEVERTSRSLVNV